VWILFVFRDAVNPSMDAAGETPVSHAPENKPRSTAMRTTFTARTGLAP
jgi:hypothetical protein